MLVLLHFSPFPLLWRKELRTSIYSEQSLSRKQLWVTEPAKASLTSSALLDHIGTPFLSLSRTPNFCGPLPVIPCSENFGHQTIILKQSFFHFFMLSKTYKNAKQRCWVVWNYQYWLENSNSKQGNVLFLLSIYNLIIGKSRIPIKLC